MVAGMSKDFTINRMVKENAFKMDDVHMHSCYELIYLISGESKIVLNENIYKMTPGSIAIVTPEAIHKTEYADNAGVRQERVVVRFNAQDIDWSCEMVSDAVLFGQLDDCVMLIPEKRRGYIENLFDRIIYEIRQSDAFSQAMTKILLQALVVLLVRLHMYGEPTQQQIDAKDEVIQKIAKYLYENYHKPIYLNEVAEQFHISRSYLSKKFKSTTGFGFKEYLLNVRIKQACNLLLETDKSITEIAFLCGFNDSNYFGDAFRRIKGISPAKFRKNQDAV